MRTCEPLCRVPAPAVALSARGVREVTYALRVPPFALLNGVRMRSPVNTGEKCERLRGAEMRDRTEVHGNDEAHAGISFPLRKDTERR
ncbi:hypothetical protein GCM10009823_14650 [Brevibacterium salitolerans]|uniref:Uncharacterized protein n=1 Tax=Brevibacterium salitolerans TaxID=1403566 RepID=A0ABN2WPN9_9MICO